MARPRRSRAASPTPAPAEPVAPGRVPALAWGFAGIAAALVVWRLAWISRRFWAQDDAYISFRFARNLVHGHGLVYNVGERVEGYTNFLWTLISAIPMALGHPDPIHAMQWLGFALLIGCWVLLLGFGVLLARRGLVAAPLAPVPLLFVWSFDLWFVSGMEAGMVAFFAIAGVVLVSLPPREHRWATVAASLAGVLAMLARADAAPIWLGLALTGLAFEWPRAKKHRLAALRPALIVWLAPPLLLYLPYTIARVAYYGSFYPNTYYAKAIYLPAWSRGWTYLETFLGVYPLALPFLLVPIAAVVARDERAKRFLTAVSLVTALVTLFVLRVGGDFMEWRFMVPVLGLALPGIVVAVAVLAGWLWRGRSPAARLTAPGVTALAVLGLAGWMQLRTPAAASTHMEGQEVIGELARYCDDRQFNFRGVALRLDELLPRGQKMALTAAGIIPFYCDRPVLDLHGLTDYEIAHEPVNPAARGRMGHEHQMFDLNEMRRRGATTLLVFENPRAEPESLAYELRGNLAMVRTRIDDGRWYSFFVLDTTRVALDPLRARPGVLVTASTRDETPAAGRPGG